MRVTVKLVELLLLLLARVGIAVEFFVAHACWLVAVLLRVKVAAWNEIVLGRCVLLAREA